MSSKVLDSNGGLKQYIYNLLGLTGLGQATKSGSLPVTLASDEDEILVGRSTGTLIVCNDGGVNGALYNGGHANLSASTSYFGITDTDVLRASSRVLYITNQTNQNITVFVQLRLRFGNSSSLQDYQTLWSELINSGAGKILVPGSAGTGAGSEVSGGNGWLEDIWEFDQIQIGISPAADPTSGALGVAIAWRI